MILFCYRTAGGLVKPPNSSLITFREKLAENDPTDDISFEGDMNNYDELSRWVTEKCVPLVREITFENAEELTEEGLPFLILFHLQEDTETVKKYRDLIDRELQSEKRKS